MPFNRPLTEKLSPTLSTNKTKRGIVSPCNGCNNNIPIASTLEEADKLDNISVVTGYPCPKKILEAELNNITVSDELIQNFRHAVFNTPRNINPVWPGENNSFAYVWVATFEDNIKNNPKWDTSYIHCRGPFLINSSEKEWNTEGHLAQGDEVLISEKNYYIDGFQFKGFVNLSSIWQSTQGYLKEVSKNMGKSMSGMGSF